MIHDYACVIEIQAYLNFKWRQGVDETTRTELDAMLDQMGELPGELQRGRKAQKAEMKEVVYVPGQTESPKIELKRRQIQQELEIQE